MISPMSLAAIDSQGGLSSGRYFKKGLENDTSALPSNTMKDSENVMAGLHKHDIMARPQTQDGANGRRRFRVGAVTHKQKVRNQKGTGLDHDFTYTAWGAMPDRSVEYASSSGGRARDEMEISHVSGAQTHNRGAAATIRKITSNQSF